MLRLAMGRSEAALMKAAVVVAGGARWEVVRVAVPAGGDPWKAAAFPPSTPASLPARNLSDSYPCSRGFAESSR